MVKSLPAMWETRVRPLSRDDPLEEGLATRSSVLAWRIPWTEEPGGLQCIGSQSQIRLRDLACTHLYISISISQFTPCLPSFLGIHMFVLYVCVSISALQVSSSVSFSRFHIKVILYNSFFFPLSGSIADLQCVSFSCTAKNKCILFKTHHSYRLL